VIKEQINSNIYWLSPIDMHALWNCRIASMPYIENDDLTLGVAHMFPTRLGELRADNIAPTYTNALFLPLFSLILYPPAVILLSTYTMKPPPNQRCIKL
jgi:hypothetical protein